MTLRSAVCFFAHPDDELLAGGIIAMLAQNRIPVHVVCATRGEGGDMGEPPVVSRREQLGAAREAEVRCAVRALGATLSVLDYVDPTVGPEDTLYAFDADPATFAGQCAEIARIRRADLVLTHGSDGEYGHPAHKLIHASVMRGTPNALPNTLIYSVAARVPAIENSLWNKNELAHLALDIRPWAEMKLAATECHLSQHALFKRGKEDQTLQETLRAVESVHRQWPPTHDEPPQDDFADLLRTVGAWTPAAS